MQLKQVIKKYILILISEWRERGARERERKRDNDWFDSG